MGLAVLPCMNDIFKDRKTIVENYLVGFKHSNIQTLTIRNGTIWNYSYFPVLFTNENKLLKTEITLNSNSILPRRYFYPSLSELSYTNKSYVPISQDISSRILCLPLFYRLPIESIELISDMVLKINSQDEVK
jgi:dTDP-4-amino-4,6-dideoxygalactose transaminase